MLFKMTHIIKMFPSTSTNYFTMIREIIVFSVQNSTTPNKIYSCKDVIECFSTKWPGVGTSCMLPIPVTSFKAGFMVLASFRACPVHPMY